ncbi:MAG: hypothetical protein EP338_10695 [Bacteroidetes bacterium]|nr:MAG: hypothetical protein EP338_10695 [Bacteroidota bacterium]
MKKFLKYIACLLFVLLQKDILAQAALETMNWKERHGLMKLERKQERIQKKVLRKVKRANKNEILVFQNPRFNGLNLVARTPKRKSKLPFKLKLQGPHAGFGLKWKPSADLPAIRFNYLVYKGKDEVLSALFGS